MIRDQTRPWLKYEVLGKSGVQQPPAGRCDQFPACECGRARPQPSECQKPERREP